MYVLIIALWVVLVGAYINGPVGDPDLWWHITVGRWIAAQHSLPTTDLWNAYSSAGSWRAYSWVHELIYATVDSVWGIQGLWTLQLLLAIAMVAAFVVVFTYLSRDLFIGAMIGTLVAVGCFQNFSLRPQVFVWMLFAASLALGQKSLRDGLTAKTGLYIVIIFSLWANSHISAIIGIGSLVLWVLPPAREGAKEGAAKLPVALLALSLIGTLITPYFGGEWFTFFGQAGDPLSMRSIVEFQSATILSYGAAILIVLSALVIAGFARMPQLFSPGRLILVLGLVCGGAAIVKFIPFAVIALGALLSVVWAALHSDKKLETENLETWPEQLGANNQLFEGIERLRAALRWLPTTGTAALLFAIIAVVVNGAAQRPLNTTLIPKAAVDFIKSHDLPTPILNDFGRGGYMMYRMSNAAGVLPTAYKVPLDGRTNVNSPEIWRAYRASVEGHAGWREILALVKPNTILWRRESPFVQLLIANGEWREEFASGNPSQGFVVLTKVKIP